jgi:hypothetical protein
MNITIKTNESGSWTVVNQTSGSGLSDGTYSYTNTSWIDTFDTKYWISFNVTDGEDWTNQTFDFTIESENTTIEVTPATWSQGDVNIGATNETTGNYFTITNNGNVNVVITVNATNATNATGVVKWDLVETASHNKFELQYKKNGEESWTNINYSYNPFIANLPWPTGSDSETFDLKIIMATTSSTTQSLNVTVTFKSVAA